MRLSALDRKLLRDLLQMKGQSLAIALVIGVGVAMFVMYRSTFDALTTIRAAFYEQARFARVFANAKRAPEGLSRRVAAIPGVAAAETRVVADVTLDLPGLDEPAMGRLVSLPAGRAPRLNAVTLVSGRTLGALPAGASRDEVLVAESFALAHGLMPGDTLAATLNGRRRRLTIVGVALSPEYVFSVRPGDLLPDPDRFGVLWMEREALAAAFDLEGSFNDLSLALAPGASEDEVIARLDRLLAPYGGTGAIPRSLQTSHWYLDNELTQLANVGSFLPMLFLGVAAFLLNVVVARVVAVQREQIAALKALGYANRALAAHYAKMSLAIAALGAAGGVALGAWLGAGLTAIYGELYRFPATVYTLPPGRVVQAVAVALTAAILGAVGGVRRAVTLPPAEAMRPEPPADYRESLLERIGLRRLLPPAARMILRNLGRRPGRTAVAVGGIAVAGALVILGSSLRDGIAVLLDEQLGVIQRQDATVTFTEPASARAVHELARIPGVVRVEPFRAVPARLRAGHRARRVSIDGLAAGAELRRVVDASGRVVDLPPAGLVLSSALAGILGVEAGDLVTVEVLEGARPVRRLPVVRLVEEHMGTAAYLDLGAVHRLLRDGRTLSGAYLEIEPSAAPAVYRRLKDTPRVAAVARSEAFLQSFHENFARNLEIMVSFTLGFAVLIAFGVVYNSARISLAERSRELASLRVLGFRQSEVSLLFLGELAAVTLAALPLAALFGYGLSAWALAAFETELYRFPVALARRTFAMAELTLIVSALVSGLVVRRRLDRLDLVAVLKTRE